MANAPTKSECVQWDGENLAEVRQFLGEQCISADPVLHLVINTPGGNDAVTVPPMGWLRRTGRDIRVETNSDQGSTVGEAEPAVGNPPLESIVDSLAYEGGFD